MPKLKPGTIWPAPAKVDLTREQLDEIAASDMTFDEVEEKYGEEIAINVGILRDPDTPGLDDDWYKRARPAAEVIPNFDDFIRRVRAARESKTREDPVHTPGD